LYIQPEIVAFVSSSILEDGRNIATIVSALCAIITAFLAWWTRKGKKTTEEMAKKAEKDAKLAEGYAERADKTNIAATKYFEIATTQFEASNTLAEREKQKKIIVNTCSAYLTEFSYIETKLKLSPEAVDNLLTELVDVDGYYIERHTTPQGKIKLIQIKEKKNFPFTLEQN